MHYILTRYVMFCVHMGVGFRADNTPFEVRLTNVTLPRVCYNIIIQYNSIYTLYRAHQYKYITFISPSLAATNVVILLLTETSTLRISLVVITMNC